MLTLKNYIQLLGCLLAVLVSAPAVGLPSMPVETLKSQNILGAYDFARKVEHELTAENGQRKKLEEIDRILLDPGHGDRNIGAYGVANIPEKWLTLELAYQLRDRLQETYPGLEVYMTRYWDRNPTITKRVHLANHLDADLLISLHYNAAPHDRAKGIETYFIDEESMTPRREQRRSDMIASLQTDGNNVEFQNARRPKPGISGSTLTLIKNDLKRAYLHRTSGQFAELLQSNLLESVEKVKDRGVKQRDFAILRGARMPTAVVEAGFLSHPDEGMRVVEKSHRRAVMNGVIDGIREFDEFLVDSLNEEFTPPF